MNRLEDDLRASLRRHASDVDVVGGMPEDVGRRAHVRRAVTAGLAGALAVAVVVVGVGLVRAVQADPPPQPAPAPPLPLVQRVHVTPHSNGDLVYVDNGAIVRRAPNGTTTTWLTRNTLTDACGHGDCTVSNLQWSPDGSRLAIVMGVVRRTSPSQYSVYVVDDDATTPRKVFACPESGCAMEGPSISWSPDATRVAVADSTAGLFISDADGSNPDPRPLCQDCQATAVAWSPDGRWLAYGGQHGIRRISTDGDTAEDVDPSTTYALGLAWSPEGTRLLVDSVHVVRVLDLSRRPYTQHTIDHLRATEGPSVPAWSPDGRRVSWFTTPGQHPRFHAEVWTARGDGSGPVRLLRSGCCVSDWSAPLWSPDGRYLSLGLALDSTQPPDLVVLDAGDGTELARVTGVGWAPMAWQARP